MTTIAPDEAPQHLETRGLQQAADLAARRERCLTIRTRLAEPGWPVCPSSPPWSP